MMTNELTTTRATTALEFTDEQRAMIRDTYANGASDDEFMVLMEIARVRNLNPMLKQVYFVKRWDNGKRREVWSTQVSIDGLRAIAERTGLYAGQDEPEFTDDEKTGLPIKCRVKVYRKDWERPAVGLVYFAECVQTTKDGSVTQFWKKMPHTMLAKVAEAFAIRKAFPEDTGGLYTNEEMPDEEPRAQRAEARVVSAQIPPPSLASLGIEPANARAADRNAAARADAETLRAASPEVADDPERNAIAQEAAEMPAELARYYEAVAMMELPGEGTALWIRSRTYLATLPAPDREAAWKALCARVEAVGKMKGAKVWLKKQIAEHDARNTVGATDHQAA